MKKDFDFKFNRLFSALLTRLFMRSSLTPNQITVLSLVCGLGAGALFSTGRYEEGVWGALLYCLACILDNCDGEIARAKNMGSVFGGWLDIAVDFLTDFALFGGLALGASKTGDAFFSVKLFFILCLSGGAMHFLLVIIEKLKGFGPAAFSVPNPDQQSRSNFLFRIFDALREGEASWLILGFAIAGKTHYLLWFGGFYMQILWISALFMNFKFLVKK